MKKIFDKHKTLWLQKSFLYAVFVGLVLLVISLFATYYANFYTAIHASNPVTDILLDNLPVVNVDFIFNEGPFIFIAILTIILLYEPRRIPFVLKSSALFTIVRAFFLTLTHIAPPLRQSYIDPTDILYVISSGNDLFFSAHTGLPFMLAITFWEEKYLRYFFLVMTVIGGAAVIFGHLHYSIDVFSALFIAFGIFHIAKVFFSRDYETMRTEPAIESNG